MISRLTHFDMVRTVSETEVSAQNIFVEEGCFSASGLIENIAQTCAARIGYVNKYILKKGIQIGHHHDDCRRERGGLRYDVGRSHRQMR